MDDLFSQLTPEQLAALLQGGTLQEQGGLLDTELAQLLADAPQHVEHSTPLGAGLGGLAEALGQGVNAYHVKALRGDRAKNLEAQQKLMGDFGALLRGPRPPASPMQTGEMIPGEWGVDLTQPTSPMQTGEYVSGEWGLDLAQPSPMQSGDIVPGQCGLDLSSPGAAAGSISRAPRGINPDLEMALPDGVGPDLSGASSAPAVAVDMTQLPRRKERRPTAFAF